MALNSLTLKEVEKLSVVRVGALVVETPYPKVRPASLPKSIRVGDYHVARVVAGMNVNACFDADRVYLSPRASS